MNNLNLEVKGFGSINEANLEINKINVVGGINSSGKSTIARLLYCYLKADVLNNKSYIKKVIIDEIAINYGFTFPPNISLSDVIHDYKSFYPQNRDINLLIEYLSQDDQLSYTNILRDLIHKENLDSFNGYSKFYNSSFESLLGNGIVNNQFDNDFVEAKDKWSKEIIGELNNRLNYLTDDDYFHEDEEYGWNDSYYEYDENEYLYDKFFGKKHGDESDDEYHGEFLDDNKLYVYKTKGSLNFFGDVFYIDSLSILDMLEFINSEKQDENKIDVINPKNHIKYLINSLTDKKNSEFILSFPESNEENESAINKIHKIIKGSISSENIVDSYKYSRSNIQQEARDFKYVVVEKETDIEVITKHISSGNTASGIKQIGIIQRLILNNKLRQNSFLIIDEPEVNLHPDWQFKFAEILVMLVKELNITIYINSHSPMFIEAIDAFTEFYDMPNDVNYYLSEFNGTDKYDFNKIESDELYKIYDNLGDAYDLIDQLRLEKYLGE